MLVTATNDDGAAAVASAPHGTVPSAPPVNTSKPAVTGIAQRSFTLSATQGSWKGIGNSYSYQWQRSPDQGVTSTRIAGATSSVLHAHDRG